jgi:methyltransferase
MLIEAHVSTRHERWLRSRGAVEPAGDPYPIMQLVYPASFAAMTIEGAVTGETSFRMVLAGLLVLVGAKALKYWAIATLGPRWTFRVLVPPGHALVSTGPYRLLRHPNYLAVLGELIGVALALGAPLTGTVAVVGFGLLLRRRILVEEGALGIGRVPE